MTRNEAKILIRCGDLSNLYNNKPMGTTLKQIFDDCISGASGLDLDTMVEKCLGLKRRTGFYMMGCSAPSETDVEFRERAENYSSMLNTYSPTNTLVYTTVTIGDFASDAPPRAICYHSWKHYVGILEIYDFCEFCDEKRRK